MALTLVKRISNSNGKLLQTFNDPTPTTADQFSRELAMQGNNVLVPARRDDTFGEDVGQAHLFDATTGELLETFDDPTVNGEDFFGRSVALDGNKIVVGAFRDSTFGVVVGQVHVFTISDLVTRGDFNEDSLLTVADIDLLIQQIISGLHLSEFDLNDDGVVNAGDRDEWLAAAANTGGFTAPYLLGDANLDGTVDASDLNALGQNWLGHPSAWRWGDFTADGTVNALDLNEIGQNWLASITVAEVTESVPEPTSVLLFIFNLAGIVCRRR